MSSNIAQSFLGVKIIPGCKSWLQMYQELCSDILTTQFQGHRLSFFFFPDCPRYGGCVSPSQWLLQLMRFFCHTSSQSLAPELDTALQSLPWYYAKTSTCALFILLLLISGKREISETTKMKRVLVKALRNRNQFKLAGVNDPRNIYVTCRSPSPAAPPSAWKWGLRSYQRIRHLLSLLLPGPQAFSSPCCSAFTCCILFRAHTAFSVAPTVFKAFGVLVPKYLKRDIDWPIFFPPDHKLLTKLSHSISVSVISASEHNIWDTYFKGLMSLKVKIQPDYTNEEWNFYFIIISYNKPWNHLEFTITWEIWYSKKSTIR